MKAIKYKVKVSEGTMDFIHGGGSWIDEIFIPEKILCFNTEKGLNIFGAEIPRDKQDKQEIEIPDDICRSLGLLLNAIEGIDKEKGELLKEITKANLFKEEK